MQFYDIEALRQPQTYQNDTELATLARKAAVEQFQANGDAGQLSLGDIKRQFLAGEHAQMVFEYLERVAAQQDVAIREYHRLLNVLIELQPPADVSIDVDGQQLKVKAPYDGGDLNRRLNRLGGRWDDWNKCSVVPLSAADSLQKVLNNWNKKFQAERKIKAEADAQRKAEQEKARQERQAAWKAQRQQEAAQEKAQREAEAQRRAKAVASRVKVTVGEYAIGDMLHGRQITGFGQAWTEATLKAGQLYQPCVEWHCDGEPVCVHCERCARHCGCDTVTVCYAYFE